MKEIIPGYYDTLGAMVVLKVGRAAVSKISKGEGWPTLEVGNSHLFHADDVHAYRDHQARTRLVKSLGWKGRGLYRVGWKGRGLYRVDDIDIVCPICEDFAIVWPAPPELSKLYLCLNGHKGAV